MKESHSPAKMLFSDIGRIVANGIKGDGIIRLGATTNTTEKPLRRRVC